MIHQYKNNGYNIVLDVTSGSVHVVDEVAYEIIAMFENHDKETILKAMAEKFAHRADVTEQDLQRYKDRNAVLELNFTGEDLSRVTAVTVGGQTAAIVHQQADSLRVSLQPELTAGWQTVTLRLEDGSERSYDRLLLVGESKTYRNVRLGCITVQQAAGVLPGDGTLVLTGSNIQLGGTDANGAQLALTMNGTLTLPWNIPDPAEGETLPTSDIDMGESGVMEGWGRLSLRSDDSAYDRNGPAVLAEGGIRLECESGQCRLVSATEGGEQ